MANLRSSNSDFTVRQKLMLTGLYLSKFDSEGLRALGFSSFTEAFNVIGYALRSPPASIKNYRDEFDPHFPNHRKGWHKRPIRAYCREIYDEYSRFDLVDFTGLVESFFGIHGELNPYPAEAGQSEDRASAFAQRLVTGLAAERYFESIHATLPMFQGLALENTTTFGCGYDFRLRESPGCGEFLAVEVKGLRKLTGSIALTPKEYEVASALRERFFLFVAKNFQEAPTHTIFQNPIYSPLEFRRTERVTIQVSWLTSV